VEGQTIALEPRSADGHMERMPGLVDELIRLKPSPSLCSLPTP
jgi:hypothetical protein